MVPAFLMALMTEVFIAYSIIESFAVEWYSMVATSVSVLFMVLPTLAAVYVGSIAREEVKKIFFHGYTVPL